MNVLWFWMGVGTCIGLLIKPRHGWAFAAIAGVLWPFFALVMLVEWIDSEFEIVWGSKTSKESKKS